MSAVIPMSRGVVTSPPLYTRLLAFRYEFGQQ
jgi:hypothetical protein